MIVCPNCLHQNPDGAAQCEACYTTLPATSSCPNCGSSIQLDASFCGQCGFNLKQANPGLNPTLMEPLGSLAIPDPVAMPDLVTPEPLVAIAPPPDDLDMDMGPSTEVELPPTVHEELPATSAVLAESQSPTIPPRPVPPPPVTFRGTTTNSGGGPKTQIQQFTARLLHLQTNTLIDFPQHLPVIHVGKPNDRIPPDINVAGLPNSEVVSRIHADVRVEGDTFFIEDVGSANGTYINNMPLLPGNRHRLRSGDRISLGKGDLVTFLFQQS